MLFDCAEGTQRQLLRSGVGLIELREIFLTHFHADHFLGLPGMLKTFALRGREVPLDLYGPPGLKNLFGVLQADLREAHLPVNLNEMRTGDVLERGDYSVVTFPVAHGVSSIGYALLEHPRPGRFDVEGADALGVPPGPERGALQRGDSVTLPDGRTITPDAVLGPARAGRKLVITGDTMPAGSVLEIAHGADVLVHEATFGEDEADRARETMHSTARGGGRARARGRGRDARRSRTFPTATSARSSPGRQGRSSPRQSFRRTSISSSSGSRSAAGRCW